MDSLNSTQLFTTLNTLLDRLGMLSALLRLPSAPGISQWDETLRKQVLPRLSPDFPLTVAITGGGSAGKSSLFNALCQTRVSPVGGKAGINRRVLAAMHPDLLQTPGRLDALFSAFGSPPAPMRQSENLTAPGPPLYTLLETAPKTWVLLDTPDFDTGAQGHFSNRQATESALTTADVLIYIFTNANYNNQENTRFVSHILTRFGYRPCVLAYRAPGDIRPEMALHHAQTVGHHLYGDQADRYILGCYRIDEDNRVSDGRQFMDPVPMTPETPAMIQTIDAVHAVDLRMRLYTDLLGRLAHFGAEILLESRTSLKWLALYRDALEAAESLAVKKTLGRFPMDAILGKFAKAWMATDPHHIKLMRKTGKVLDFPVKVVVRAGKWISKSMGATSKKEAGRETEPLETDLVLAANRLRAQLAGERIDISLGIGEPLALRMQSEIHLLEKGPSRMWGPDPSPQYTPEAQALRFHIPAHPSLAKHRKDLQVASWAPTLNAIVSQKETILKLSDTAEKELRRLAVELRERLDFWGQARQTAAAAMNILPAAAAVAYILSTGDPVGAVGIKVKLAGLFGLHDLYALVALPATSGLKAADQRQLEQVLGPVAQTWLNSRMATVRNLFRETMTGPVLDAALGIIGDAETLERQTMDLLQQLDALEKGNR